MQICNKMFIYEAVSGHAVRVFHLHNTAERKLIGREKTIIYTHLIGKCQRDKRGKGMAMRNGWTGLMNYGRKGRRERWWGGGGSTFDQMGPGLLCESSRCSEILGHRNACSR